MRPGVRGTNHIGVSACVLLLASIAPLSIMLSWLLTRMLGVRVSMCYLHDYLLISIDSEESQTAYEVFTLLLPCRASR
jgi:hypothetical protein